MTTVTADSLYQLIKQYESTFPLPAPYVTVNVRDLQHRGGHVQGLTTKVSTDLEPIEHGPHDHPTNPAPAFVGNVWQEITINAQWRRTVTALPAPVVPLAPVLLLFAIDNPALSWSVTVAGFTTTAPAGQTTLSVSIWDQVIVPWQIQAGGKLHGDQLRIDRPAGLPGAGAFTIPVIPVGIIYAPPVDSLGKSGATYGVGDTVGTTVSYDFSTDSSTTVPHLNATFTDFNDFKNALDVVGTVLGLNGDMAAKNGLAAISSAIGTATQTEQTGTVEGNGSALTVTESSTENVSTNTKGGGPGVGDVIVFYKDMRVAWAYSDGQLRLCPLGHTKEVVTAQFLQTNLATVGISSADQQYLLSLDPFVAGGPYATPPSGRFTVPDDGEVHLDYGGGASIDQKYAKTKDTKTTATNKTYTTETSNWDPGSFLKLLGIGGDKTQVTTTETNAVASDVSTTTTIEANLFAGPDDYFVVTLWYDQLFGTWAFQQGEAGSAQVVSGTGTKPGDVVRLKVGNSTYVTVANAKGAYAFRAKSIPHGAASLTVGSQPATTVNIGGGHVITHLPTGGLTEKVH